MGLKRTIFEDEVKRKNVLFCNFETIEAKIEIQYPWKFVHTSLPIIGVEEVVWKKVKSRAIVTRENFEAQYYDIK